MPTKVCLRCSQTLPADQFSRNKNRPDGLQAYCKACTKAANAASMSRNAARTDVEIPAEKRCARCGQTKPAAAFYADRRRRDGLYANCRDCHRIVTDGWKAAHADEVLATRRASYQRNAEVRRAESRAYARAHAEATTAKNAAWKAENRARATAHEAVRRARIAGAAGHATAEQIAARVAYYGGRCWMCRAPWEHIDHVKPVARGGSNWPANLRPACASCNSAKRDRWPLAA